MPSRVLRALTFCALCAAAPARAEVRIEVRGLSDPEKANVELRLGTSSVTGVKEDDDTAVRRLDRQAESDIRTALQAYGYYSPQVTARLTADGDDWLAEYDIDAGPPTRISAVDVQLVGDGAGFGLLRGMVAQLPVREGERLIHANYEAAKALLSRTGYSNGFLDAQFTRHELRVNPELRTAEVLLTFDTGRRFFIGEIRIEQDELDPEFIGRYVPLRTGEPFDPDRLLRTQFALSDLDYFQSVEMVAQRADAQGDRIPVTIRTTPRLPRRYDFGIGYGTDTGARLSFGTEFRRLNRQGHKLRADMRLSEIKNSLGTEYRIPLGDRPGESLSFNGALTYEKLADGDSRKWQVGTALARTPGDWQRRVYLNLEHEDFRFESTGTTTTDLLIPGISLSRTDTDDPIHARKGWFVFADMHGAHEAVISSTSFLQSHVVARGALPFGARGRLLGRLESGASYVDEFNELPASQRFFAGGDQSVRGYGYRELGPKNDEGKVVGGEYLLAMSIEAEYIVWREWGIAAFYDAGNAYDDPDTELFRGVGGGVRWRAPIGTLQVDFAHPLDDPDRNVRVHIGIRVGL